VILLQEDDDDREIVGRSRAVGKVAQCDCCRRHRTLRHNVRASPGMHTHAYTPTYMHTYTHTRARTNLVLMHERDGLLIGDDVPNAVAAENEKLVFVADLKVRHVRLCSHVRLVLRVTCACACTRISTRSHSTCARAPSERATRMSSRMRPV
jgi:hypothetical protein